MKFLNVCRTKFLREVQILIRKLRDFEGQIGELSRTYGSRYISAVSCCLQASCPREAKFITLWSLSLLNIFYTVTNCNLQQRDTKQSFFF